MTIEEIGKRLREIRKEKGWNSIEVEEKTTYCIGHIRAMERGEKMSLFSLCFLLDVYGYELKIEPKG